MKDISYSAGTVIHKAGDPAKTLDFIVSGKVEIRVGAFSVNAGKGSVIGILEQAGNPYSYDYIASEDVTVNEYTFTRFSDVHQIIEDQFDNCEMIITSTAKTVLSLATKYRQLRKLAERFYSSLSKYYSRYKEICGLHGLEIQSFPFLETTSPFVPTKDMPDWVTDYYDQLEIMPDETKKAFFATHSSLATASLWDASSHAKLFLSGSFEADKYLNDVLEEYFLSSKADLFDLFNNLLSRGKNANDIKYEIKTCVNDIIDEWESNPKITKEQIESKKAIFKDLLSDNEPLNATSESEDAAPAPSRYELVENSLDTILRYTNTDEAEDERFHQMVSEFKALKDKNSSQDDVANLRRDITKSFLDIYESAIISSFEAPKTPTILKMFFNFGYMDEELIGRDNALLLYDMVENLSYSPEQNVYTIYDWLKSIYTGENEPSKNEFDQDYQAYIKTQKASGYITEDMEARYLSSNKEKLRFEIRNFFKSAMKVCTGRPSTFFPILSDHNIIKTLEAMVITADKITKNWTIIRSIDYSAFYRPCVFQSPEYHITRESILLEVMPNIILMPTIGSKAQLWQETSGVRRDTPARIAMPIFTDEDLFIMQLKLTAEFRWEICKRVQGARWNDVTDHSLTSDYFDYLQFYRKNNDLSADAKEKVKSQILNSRNSFKNVFVADYISWVRYEALGSPRVNKVAKAILFSYCPFSKTIRDKLKTNPMYENMISRHEIKAAKNAKTLSARYSKLKDSNGSLPPEIIDFVKYYTK